LTDVNVDTLCHQKYDRKLGANANAAPKQTTSASSWIIKRFMTHSIKESRELDLL
jgi:hypothetical protein